MINRMNQPSATLHAKKITPAKAPLAWRLSNMLRWGYFYGWLTHVLGHALTWLTGSRSARTLPQLRTAVGAWMVVVPAGRIDASCRSKVNWVAPGATLGKVQVRMPPASMAAGALAVTWPYASA